MLAARAVSYSSSVNDLPVRCSVEPNALPNRPTYTSLQRIASSSNWRGARGSLPKYSIPTYKSPRRVMACSSAARSCTNSLETELTNTRSDIRLSVSPSPPIERSASDRLRAADGRDQLLHVVPEVGVMADGDPVDDRQLLKVRWELAAGRGLRGGGPDRGEGPAG